MTARYPTILLLPDTEASVIFRSDRAYHAAAGAREAAQRKAEARQRAVDAVLPAFLLAAQQRAWQGSVWTNLADLAIAFASQSVDDPSRAGIGHVHDLAISSARGAEPPERVLPRGSRLHLLEPYYEIWGYGYLAGVFYDLAVETGAMAGRTVTVGDHARTSCANGVSRRTLAGAMIVPAEGPEASESGAAVRRYEQAIAALRTAGAPVTPTDTLFG